MREQLTPKQVARAIDVSESSVKRWCDKGAIPTSYTAGGHRRIPLNGLLEFLRSTKQALVAPEVLGLPSNVGRSERVIDRAANQLCSALLAGDEEASRQIVLDLYLQEHSLSHICDKVIAEAFGEVGHQWECGMAEVFQERHACEITLRLLREVRALISPPSEDAPRAIGGTPAGDQYSLGTTMAELVLREARWNAISLGDNLPFETLAAAIQEHRPQLFWLSCSHMEDASAFLEGYMWLYEEFNMNMAFVVGGQCLTDAIRQQMKYTAFCDNMQHLDSFASTFRSAIEAE